MRLVFALIFLLTACSRTPVTPVTPLPELPLLTINKANCPQVRFLLLNGTYSIFWGGEIGLVVSEEGFTIHANPKQVQCKRDGVFKPLQAE